MPSGTVDLEGIRGLPISAGVHAACDDNHIRVVVVEGVDNSTPQTPLTPNDNDPDPGPTVIPMADPECEARALVEDLCVSLAEAVEAIAPADEDAETAR